MAHKPNRAKEPEQTQRSRHGMKIYFNDETEQWLREKAKNEGFRSAQDMIHEQIRRARIKEKNCKSDD